MTYAPGDDERQALEGLIFLPTTNNPAREFGSWEAQILLRRGIGEGLSYEEQLELHAQLVGMRAQYLGEQALATTVEL